MTYVELIVVLSIFAVMSSIVMFNYSGFQAKIDIKNLASDIALKVVQAQKSSLSGFLPPATEQYSRSNVDTWKPSYGVYFDITSDSNKRSFVYFVDLDYTTPPQNGFFDGSGSGCTFECIEQITMTRGDYISSLEVFYQDNFVPEGLNDLTISFSRPNSGAVIKSSTVFSGIISYVQITISTPNSTTAKIKLYPSGRIQVN
ncbi:MAG: hypothetical protein UR90_C0007G0011 [Parcubacteria group bacterium GW2011_GWC1_35_8]|nr:MAG: hypothetical protein UR90_C0007G0011 [Parcubacteria group bacterium GW2011_GWC1_35_8]OGJ06305.1 MAG: hypothetical protein A2238_00460 [Candidatus Nomurabacteria bacterium RIFOXYA2_FULL_35_9]OGJ10249.1 MAG: hypothetical protein A2456_03245 [Candidatus Nomurabacteria bacterium RIFOXYC2_FULL_36_19]OGJ14296.1 MAG: hypothetical protein A2554_00800 [Candidatus Nomurabacteria bacterium RIFOXYD2_FULL_35_12]